MHIDGCKGGLHMGTKNINLSLGFNPDHYYYRNSWVQLIRPMTLTGTLTPILVGTGFAAINGTIRFDIFFALLLSSLLVQAATNMLNDYYDFKYGQDQEKRSEEHTSELQSRGHLVCRLL